MGPPVTYETRHALDDGWPVPADCVCWGVRPPDMAKIPTRTAFKPDDRIVMLNAPRQDGVSEANVLCGTCAHAGEAPLVAGMELMICN